MTASTHAFGTPVTILPARTPRAAVRRKGIPRQLRARRIMLLVTALFAGAVVAGTLQQIAAHGWRAFVFRAPGVGGSPPQPDAPAAAAKPVIPAAPQVVPPSTPPATRHHALRHHPTTAPTWHATHMARATATRTAPRMTTVRPRHSTRRTAAPPTRAPAAEATTAPPPRPQHEAGRPHRDGEPPRFGPPAPRPGPRPPPPPPPPGR